MTAVQIEELHYQIAHQTILSDLHWKVGEGESWIILGRNGSGKSTLIQIIFGSLWPTAGKVSVFGFEYGTTPIKDLQAKMGVLQGSMQEQLLQKTLTVREILLTGLYSTLGLYKDPSPNDLKTVDGLLSQYQLSSKADQVYHTLSSGEKIQILLIRSLVKNPQLLILDEPTANLDLTARVEFFQLLQSVKTQNPRLSLLMVLHRIEEIPSFFTHACLLKSGKVLSMGEIHSTLTSENVSRLYDLALHLEKKEGSFLVHKVPSC